MKWPQYGGYKSLTVIKIGDFTLFQHLRNNINIDTNKVNNLYCHKGLKDLQLDMTLTEFVILTSLGGKNRLKIRT